MAKRRNCIGSGVQLARWAQTSGDLVIFPENVQGYVRQDDLVVPHSELAMHVRAAGRPLLAWACRKDGRSCAVAFEEPSGDCGFTTGLAGEVLTPAVQRAMQKFWGHRMGFGGRRR